MTAFFQIDSWHNHPLNQETPIRKMSLGSLSSLHFRITNRTTTG